MFWNKKQTEATSLEELCSGISTAAIKSCYEKGGLYQALALVNLKASGEIKDRLLKYPEMSGLFRNTNRDVLIAEVATLIQSQLAYSNTMNPLDLAEDEEEEFTDSIYESLAFICAFITKYTGFTDLNEKMARRSYSPNTEQAISQFTKIIQATVGRKEPVESLQSSSTSESLLEGVALGTAVMSLWSTLVLAAVETSQNIALAHFNNEI